MNREERDQIAKIFVELGDVSMGIENFNKADKNLSEMEDYIEEIKFKIADEKDGEKTYKKMLAGAEQSRDDLEASIDLSLQINPLSYQSPEDLKEFIEKASREYLEISKKSVENNEPIYDVAIQIKSTNGDKTLEMDNFLKDLEKSNPSIKRVYREDSAGYNFDMNYVLVMPLSEYDNFLLKMKNQELNKKSPYIMNEFFFMNHLSNEIKLDDIKKQLSENMSKKPIESIFRSKLGLGVEYLEKRIGYTVNVLKRFMEGVAIATASNNFNYEEQKCLSLLRPKVESGNSSHVAIATGINDAEKYTEERNDVLNLKNKAQIESTKPK